VEHNVAQTCIGSGFGEGSLWKTRIKTGENAVQITRACNMMCAIEHRLKLKSRMDRGFPQDPANFPRGRMNSNIKEDFSYGIRHDQDTARPSHGRDA
jgi:hypothetical protein